MNVKRSSSLAAKSFFPLHFACCHLLLCHRPLVGPMEDHQGCQLHTFQTVNCPQPANFAHTVLSILSCTTYCFTSK